MKIRLASPECLPKQFEYIARDQFDCCDRAGRGIIKLIELVGMSNLGSLWNFKLKLLGSCWVLGPAGWGLVEQVQAENDVKGGLVMRKIPIIFPHVKMWPFMLRCRERSIRISVGIFNFLLWGPVRNRAIYK